MVAASGGKRGPQRPSLTKTGKMLTCRKQNLTTFKSSRTRTQFVDVLVFVLMTDSFSIHLLWSMVVSKYKLSVHNSNIYLNFRNRLVLVFCLLGESGAAPNSTQKSLLAQSLGKQAAIGFKPRPPVFTPRAPAL